MKGTREMSWTGKEREHKGDVAFSDGVHLHFHTPSKLFVRLVRFSLLFYIS